MAETYTAPITAPNIAETLAKVLPKVELLGIQYGQPQPGDVLRFAVPSNSTIKEIDTEFLLPSPRRTKGMAVLDDVASFLGYVKRHAVTTASVVWCSFDPQSYALEFTAVFDDHTITNAGWRGHRAVFKPAMSVEWKAWAGANKNAMGQVAFAEWLQNHEDDIAAAEGMPTSLQLMTMATEFVANEEHALKSAVRLQSGGVRLTYIADPDKNTTEMMTLFEKFTIGIPVFHGVKTGWGMVARLKYRLNSGKVSFFYELVRPDRVHAAAANELIAQVTAGLGTVPMFMGDMEQ